MCLNLGGSKSSKSQIRSHPKKFKKFGKRSRSGLVRKKYDLIRFGSKPYKDLLFFIRPGSKPKNPDKRPKSEKIG